MQNISEKQPSLPRSRNFLTSHKVVPYVFVAPFIIFFLLVYLYPLIMTIIMSFQKIDGPNHHEFIGIKNWIRATSGWRWKPPADMLSGTLSF